MSIVCETITHSTFPVMVSEKHGGAVVEVVLLYLREVHNFLEYCEIVKLLNAEFTLVFFPYSWSKKQTF